MNMRDIIRCYVVKGEQGWGIWQMTDEALTRRTKEDPTIPDRLDSQLFGTWEEVWLSMEAWSIGFCPDNRNVFCCPVRETVTTIGSRLLVVSCDS